MTEKRAFVRPGEKFVLKGKDGERSFVADEPLTFYQAVNRALALDQRP